MPRQAKLNAKTEGCVAFYFCASYSAVKPLS